MLTLLLLLLSAWGAGSLALRPLRGCLDPWEWTGFSLGFGFAILSYGAFFLGLGGLLIPWVLWLWVILPALLCVLPILRRKRSHLIAPPSAVSLASWTLYEKLIGCIWIFSLLLFGLVAGAPPVAWDALAYHLALPKLYMKHGHTAFIPYINTSEWPALMEMLYLLAMTLGKPQTAQGIHWVMGVLVTFWVWRVGRLFSCRWVGLTAAALLSTLVIFKILAVNALVDLGFSFYSLMALYALWRYQKLRSARWLVLTGLSAGLAGAVKLTGFFWLAILLMVLVLYRFSDRPRTSLKPMGLNGLRIGMLFLSVMFPWLARSALETGNPVWPFLYSLFGGKYWSAAQSQRWFRFGFENIPGDSPFDSFWKKLVEMFAVTEVSDFLPGPLLIAFGLLLLFHRKRLFPAQIRSALSVIGVYALAYLLFLPQSVRYLTPILPLIALGVSEGFYKLTKRGPLPRWIAYGGIFLLLAFRFPAVDTRLWTKVRVAMGSIPEESYLQEVLDIYPITLWINRHLMPGERVLMLNDIRGFYLCPEYVWGDPINQRYIDYDALRQTEDLLRRWRRRGITHILVKGNRIFWPAEGDAAIQTFLSATPPLMRLGNFSVFSIKQKRR